MKVKSIIVLFFAGLTIFCMGISCKESKTNSTSQPKPRIATPQPKPRVTQAEHRPIDMGETLKILGDLQDFLNHNPPAMIDFETLYGGTEAVKRQQTAERDYCQQVLKIAPDSKDCAKAMKRLGWKSGSSLYLLIIKDILTENQASAVEIYIDPSTKACASTNGTNSVKAQALANNKLHDLTLVLPCDFAQAKNQSAIIDFIIDGKPLIDHLKSMTAPISPRK